MTGVAPAVHGAPMSSASRCLRLPPDERGPSPHTGFTRAHWEAAADGPVRAAWRWATPGGALLDLPGRPSRSGVRSDGLEGYARTFLAAAFRGAGAGGADPYGLLGRYTDGPAAGTRTPGRDDAESWPLIMDQHIQGQPMVESTSVALGLGLTRPWLWDRLGGGTPPPVHRAVRRWRHVPAGGAGLAHRGGGSRAAHGRGGRGTRGRRRGGGAVGGRRGRPPGSRSHRW